MKVLVEVAEVRACKASCHMPQRLSNFARRRSWLVEVAEVRACKASCPVYPHHLSNFPGEADRDAGAGAEGIENVTSTGNS